MGGCLVAGAVSAYVDALHDPSCTAEQAARLFRYASLHWYEMQPIFYRASHLKACESCGKLYIDHPADASYPFLNRLCNGDLVKL